MFFMVSTSTIIYFEIIVNSSELDFLPCGVEGCTGSYNPPPPPVYVRYAIVIIPGCDICV